MVIITGNVFRHLIGSDAFQEVDTVGIVEPIVKHAFFVDQANDIAHTVREAFALAKDGRPGPVLIDITKNAQADPITEQKIYTSRIKKEAPSIDIDSLENVIETLKHSQKPVVIYGHGVTLSGAHDELEAFLEKSGIPTVWTFMGIGGANETLPHRYGMLGMHGTMAANHAVHNADCIIGIGIRFDDRIYGKLTEFQKDKSIIHFDIDTSEFGKNVSNTVSVAGDIRSTLPLVTERLEISREQREIWKNWKEQIDTVDAKYPLEKNDEGAFTQISVIDMLYEIKESHDTVIVDVGQHQMWSAQRFRSRHPRTFHGSG